MAGRKSSVVTGPPVPCIECRQPYRSSVVTGAKARRKWVPHGLCPSCAKKRKTQKDS